MSLWGSASFCPCHLSIWPYVLIAIHHFFPEDPVNSRQRQLGVVVLTRVLVAWPAGDGRSPGAGGWWVIAVRQHGDVACLVQWYAAVDDAGEKLLLVVDAIYDSLVCLVNDHFTRIILLALSYSVIVVQYDPISCFSHYKRWLRSVRARARTRMHFRTQAIIDNQGSRMVCQ